MKEPKDIADNYFEKYSKLTTSTNNIVTVALLVLITNWLFIVEANYNKYISIKSNYKEKIQIIDSKLSVINQRYLDDTTAYKEERQKLLDQKEETKTEKEKSLKDELSEIKDLPSFIKFIFFISDNPEKGGLILNLFFLGVLIYLFFSRRTSLKYVSKAVRIYKCEPSLQINRYQDFNLSSPLWLAPLPKEKFKDVTPTELKTVLGCIFSHRRMMLIVVVCLISLFIIQCRLSYITFIVNGSSFNYWFFIGASLTGLTLLVIIFWLLPIHVEDNFNYEQNPNSITRKDFILFSAFGLIYLAFYKFAPLLPKYIHKRNPRFKINTTKSSFSLPNIKSTFIQNKKSKIIHYVDSQGISQSFKAIDNIDDFYKFVSHIEPFDNINKLTIENKKPRLPIGHSNWHAENFALENLRIGNINNVVSVLLYAIKFNMDNYLPCYRLADLLALIYIKYQTEISNDVWSKFIQICSNTKDRVLMERVKKWQDSKWQKKIAKKQNLTFAKKMI